MFLRHFNYAVAVKIQASSNLFLLVELPWLPLEAPVALWTPRDVRRGVSESFQLLLRIICRDSFLQSLESPTCATDQRNSCGWVTMRRTWCVVCTGWVSAVVVLANEHYPSEPASESVQGQRSREGLGASSGALRRLPEDFDSPESSQAQEATPALLYPQSPFKLLDKFARERFEHSDVSHCRIDPIHMITTTSLFSSHVAARIQCNGAGCCVPLFSSVFQASSDDSTQEEHSASDDTWSYLQPEPGEQYCTGYILQNPLTPLHTNMYT